MVIPEDAGCGGPDFTGTLPGEGVDRIITATSNDNLPSLYFYQRHGFRVSAVAPDAFAVHLKDPNAVGFAGLPVRDEIQLEKRLAP